jgi:copper transport protein
VIRRMPRLAAAVLLTILLAAASEGAHAHAVLEESTPADGAALESAPDRVTLRFNEPVRVMSLRLVDESGQATPLAQDPETPPDRVEAPLPLLSPGSYVVSWRLLSLDGHPVGGAAFFTLGTALRLADPGAMVRAAETPVGLRMAQLVVRALTYACALLASGLALFLVLFGRYTAVDPRAVARPAVAAALLGAVATATGAAVQSAMLAGGLVDALDPTALASVLGTGFGLGALVRMGGFVVLLVALARHDFVPVLGAAGALAVAASFALTGHTVRLDSPVLSALLVFHLLAVALWTGSFIPLARAIRGTDVAATTKLMRAFSVVAVVLVPGLIAAGAAIAWFLVGEWPALVATPYGLALSAKITLVAGMLALAAVNKWRLVPGPADRSRRSGAAAAFHSFGGRIGAGRHHGDDGIDERAPADRWSGDVRRPRQAYRVSPGRALRSTADRRPRPARHQHAGSRCHERWRPEGRDGGDDPAGASRSRH